MRRLGVAIAVLALVMSACGKLFDPAAAVVEGHKITVEEVAQGLDEFKQTDEYKRLTAQGNADAIQRQFEQAYLSQLIRRAVLEPQAEDAGIEVTEQEVTDRMNEIEGSFDSPDAFQEALKEQGLDEDRLRVLVRDNLLESDLKTEVTKSVEPSEADLRGYYNEHLDDFTQTRSQHILVDSKTQANDLYNQLQAIPPKQVDEVFAQLAKKFSQDEATASKGGDLGFKSADELGPDYSQVADTLDIGEIARPLQTQQGFEIIRVTDRRTTPFEDVRGDISEQVGTDVKDAAFNEWLQKIYRDSDIRVNSRYGELDTESQQVVDPTAQNIPGAERSPSPSTT